MKKILFPILLLMIYIGSFGNETSDKIDSLKHELTIREIADTGHITQIDILSKLCVRAKHPNIAVEYGYKALELSEKYKYTKKKAYIKVCTAISESLLGNYQKSIKLNIEGAKEYHEMGLHLNEACALHSIANTFAMINDTSNSITYFKLSLEIFEELKDTNQISGIYLNIGELYRTNKRYDKALFFFKKSEALLISLLPSLSNYTKTLALQNIATINGNIGMVYFATNHYSEAKNKLIKACNYFETKNDNYRKSVYQCELGKLYIKEGNTQEGEKLIRNSLELAEKEGLKEQISAFSKDLSIFYENQYDFEKSLFYYKKYKAFFDSVQNLENIRNLEQQQSHFRIAQKEEKIESLNKINKLQRLIAYIAFIIIIFISIIIFILYNTNKKIKTYNKEIEYQKQLIEIREKEKALLLRELNHRVKNNLQMVASLLNLQARQLKGHPAAEALMAGKYRVEALTLIHQKLYRDDVDTKIDIKDYIEELSRNLVMNFGPKFELELFLVPIIMKMDKAIPLGLIINELVTNSLKYGQIDNDHPSLRIAITTNEEDVTLKIQDNGKGLSSDFDIKTAKSFGLKLVNSLSKQLGGTIAYSNKNGTNWEVKLQTKKIS